MATGYDTMAYGAYSFSEGRYSKAVLQGEHAHASGYFAAEGDAQYSRLVARKAVTHSDAAWYTLTLDGASALMTIPEDTVWVFEAQVVGMLQHSTEAYSYTIVGTIENDGTAGAEADGSTVLLSSTVTTLYESDATYDCQAVADDTNDALLIQVQDTDGASGVVRWVCTINLTQVSFP